MAAGKKGAFRVRRSSRGEIEPTHAKGGDESNENVEVSVRLPGCFVVLVSKFRIQGTRCTLRLRFRSRR